MFNETGKFTILDNGFAGCYIAPPVHATTTIYHMPVHRVEISHVTILLFFGKYAASIPSQQSEPSMNQDIFRQVVQCGYMPSHVLAGFVQESHFDLLKKQL